MKIEIKDVITLDDNNKYVVCGKVDYQDKYYLYLVDMNDLGNVKFGLEKNENNQIKIVGIEDENLIRILLPLFHNQIQAG